MAKQGRPSIYTEDLAKDICDKIASSSKGLKKLCAENPHWPNKDTIFTWLKNNPAFADQYARAKRCQIEALIDEIIEIADDDSNDQKLNESGSSVCNKEFIARSRLRIDTRKWLASKLVPKVYGSSVEVSLEEDDEIKEDIRKLRLSLESKARKEY